MKRKDTHDADRVAPCLHLGTVARRPVRRLLRWSRRRAVSDPLGACQRISCDIASGRGRCVLRQGGRGARCRQAHRRGTGRCEVRLQVARAVEGGRRRQARLGRQLCRRARRRESDLSLVVAAVPCCEFGRGAPLVRSRQAAIRGGAEGLQSEAALFDAWPASGIWAKSAVDTPEAVAKLKIRTYDKTGTDLMTALGAAASVVSFADLPAKLKAG